MTEGEGHRNVIMTEVSNFWTQLFELGGGIRLWFHDLKHFTLEVKLKSLSLLYFHLIFRIEILHQLFHSFFQ